MKKIMSSIVCAVLPLGLIAADMDQGAILQRIEAMQKQIVEQQAAIEALKTQLQESQVQTQEQVSDMVAEAIDTRGLAATASGALTLSDWIEQLTVTGDLRLRAEYVEHDPRDPLSDEVYAEVMSALSEAYFVDEAITGDMYDYLSYLARMGREGMYESYDPKDTEKTRFRTRFRLGLKHVFLSQVPCCAWASGGLLLRRVRSEGHREDPLPHPLPPRPEVDGPERELGSGSWLHHRHG